MRRSGLTEPNNAKDKVDTSTPDQPASLLNRNFLLLWHAQFVSRLGNQAYIIAMMFWLKHATGSASLMGLILMLSRLPGVLLGPFCGAVVDRFSRRRVVVLCDGISGLAGLALATVVFCFPSATAAITVSLFCVSVLTGTASAFLRPAVTAAIPDLVPTDRVVAANSMDRTSVWLATSVGQGLGGILFRLVGAPLLFLMDALTFLVAASGEFFVDMGQKNKPADDGSETKVADLMRDMLEGFRYVWRRAGLRQLMAVRGVMNFCFAPIWALLPFYVEDHLGAGVDWYGFLIAVAGIGGVIGFVTAGAVPALGRGRAVPALWYFLIFAVITVALGCAATPMVALVLMFFHGLSMALFNINVITAIQLRTPADTRGRVFALLNTLAGGLMPLGMGLAGVVADLTGQNIPLIFGVCGGVMVVASLVAMANRPLREYLAVDD
ncbi:MFS transporter [Planctomycetota bacterium]